MLKEPTDLWNVSRTQNKNHSTLHYNINLDAYLLTNHVKLVQTLYWRTHCV